jgi:hypothetical protein
MTEDTDYKNLFGEKLSCSILKAVEVSGGRNSKVFLIETSKDQSFIAKVYHRNKADNRDRLAVEFNSLNFLWLNGFRDIPKPVNADQKNGFAIYELVEGEKINPVDVTLPDIDTAVDFLVRLEKLKTKPEADLLPPASDAFFSFEAITAHIHHRFDRLNDTPIDGILGKELFDFLHQELSPFFEQIKGWLPKKAAEIGLPMDRELPISERLLSSSDYGFHNALRQQEGAIVFMDFEYFGWDDPAKTIVDFILHPAMKFGNDLKQRFATGVLSSFTQFKNLRERVHCVYPLFGVKWCLILLNEFVPADLARRNFARSSSSDIKKRRRQQLSKAKNMLQEVRHNHFKHSDFIEQYELV